ncbi:hypothetical protein, partial [Methylobacterium crusticola]
PARETVRALPPEPAPGDAGSAVLVPALEPAGEKPAAEASPRPSREHRQKPARAAVARPPADDPDDEPEAEPARAAAPGQGGSYVGIWGPSAAACASRRSSRRGFLPAVIGPGGARAGQTACAFRDARRSGNVWSVAATCRNARQRWSSHVRLAVEGNRLTWSSERGSVTYTRCSRG